MEADRSSPGRCVNLALNGLTPGLYADYFRRYLETHDFPKLSVVEVRNCAVEDTTWFSGPCWNFVGTSQEMVRSRGFATGDTIGKNYSASEYEDHTYPWRENPSGKEAFESLMQLVKGTGVTVVLMRSPGPELVESYRLRDRFDDGFSAFVEELRSDNSDSRIEVFRPMGFVDTDFADDHHLSTVGGLKLSQQLSEFLGSLSGTPSL